VESFVRAVHGHARVRNQPSTTTEEARRALALALATEFTFLCPHAPEAAAKWQVALCHHLCPAVTGSTVGEMAPKSAFDAVADGEDGEAQKDGFGEA
jgi:hypothetical protein